MSAPVCPFCERDPFHYVDNGIGMEAVAVDCCELGNLYFRGARAAPEEIDLSWEEFSEIGQRLLSTSTALREMREAWQPISTAPQGEDVLIAVFRDDFEDPIIQNSILIDGEERGLYWSDWHGMPEPTHWMRYSRPGSTPAAPAITQAELVELLALMDAADSALDKDTYDQSLRDEFDAPDDADYSVCAGTVRKCSAVFAAIEKLRNRMSKP